MSDWSMYELDDIVWDEFDESGDHIVPHPSGEQGHSCDARGDCHKKPRREAVTTVKKSLGSRSIGKDAIQGKDETSYPSVKYEKAPMLESSSWSCLPDVPPDMRDGAKEEKGSVSGDDNTSDNCFKSSKLDSIGNEICENDAILGNGDGAIGSNLCRFPLDEPTDSELGFFGSAHEDKESCDLLYYGWPDIGNFEDVDKMFRSCDSTFGQGTASNDEDLSWFSSRAFNGSEDALKSGEKASHSDASALNSTPKHCEADMKFMPEPIPPVTDTDQKNVPHDYMSSQMLNADESANVGQSYENWLNGTSEDKRELLLQKQALELNQQTSNVDVGTINLEGEQSKHQGQLGGRADRFSQYLCGDSISDHGIMQQSAELPTSVPSTTQIFPSPSVARQETSLQSDPFGYPQTYIPCVNSDYNYPSNQIPVTPTASTIKSENNCLPSLSSMASSYASNHVIPMTMPLSPSPKSPTKSENKIKRLFRQQNQTHAIASMDPKKEALVGRAAFSDQIQVQKQLHHSQDEAREHGEVERAHTKFLVEVDSSTLHEGSCVSSALSDDISLEATTFRQLQYVMEQLDVRTKLCIRDSLYRLARNAAQRCSSGNPNKRGRDSKDRSKLLTPEVSDRYTGLLDIETDTNPIDRSIAYLLFHRPSDPSTRPPNDAFSLIHGSISSQPLIHENMVNQEEISGSDPKLFAADQS